MVMRSPSLSVCLAYENINLLSVNRADSEPFAMGQKPSCADGDHVESISQQIEIKYSASSFAEPSAALRPLSGTGDSATTIAGRCDRYATVG